MPALEDNLLETVCDHTAGDPMREDVVWTYLSSGEIATQLQKQGTPVCSDTVRSLLKEFGFSRRKVEKTKTMGHSEFRNEQFENIAALQAEYFASGNPVISMDTKKKEHLGNLSRSGTAWTTGPNAAWDHDFPSWATGVLIPHGLYDLARNIGHITLGTSHDTSQFACESLLWWWRHRGRRAHPAATAVLLLCDGGGSNNSRHHIFKQDLQHVARLIGLPIRVAHYPPHCSKYNPIEHRLFPHVTRAWSGVIFRSLDIAIRCLRRTWTSTGLKVTVTVLDKIYKLKRKATDYFLNSSTIRYHDPLPDWNYTTLPSLD
jgi:DDE family transposase